MSIAEANLELPSNFTGVVKLFPLPNLVLFPGVIQPLHIFEQRYRKMIQDAINSDQIIAMACVKDADAAADQENPEIHQTICVGKIVTHAELPDGRFNLLLLGAKRAKVIRELPSNLPYRLADVKLLQPTQSEASQTYDGPIRRKAISLFEQLLEVDKQLDNESVAQLLNDELPFGLLLDLLTFSSGATLKDQQKVLETTDVLGRANIVIEILQSRLANKQQEQSKRFPPRFSYN